MLSAAVGARAVRAMQPVQLPLSPCLSFSDVQWLPAAVRGCVPPSLWASLCSLLPGQIQPIR